MVTFSKIWGAIPRRRRIDRLKVMAALFIRGALSSHAAVETSEVQKTLRLHLRGSAPKNVSHSLRTAVPDVEVTEDPSGNLRWWITPTGVQQLVEISGLALDVGDTSVCHLRFDDLHPVVRGSARQLFLDKHYSEAVGSAMKHVNILLRQRAGLTADDGVPMMHRVLSADNNGHVRLVIGNITEQWERDRQDGFKMLMAGAQQHISNVHKHGHLEITNDQIAMEMLGMLSYFARTLGASQRTTGN